MIDNFKLIIPLLEGVFNTCAYPVSFHVQVLQRSKDGHDKATRFVTEWFIGSIDSLLFIKPAVKSLCKEYNARCYINLNPKLDETVMWKMLKSISERLETRSYNFKSVVSHCHDSCQGHSFKRWIVDIDTVVDVTKLIEDINACQSSNSDDNFIETIPTKNGVHLITRPFDMTQLVLPEGVEIKKNNPTLLYYE